MTRGVARGVASSAYNLMNLYVQINEHKQRRLISTTINSVQLERRRLAWVRKKVRDLFRQSALLIDIPLSAFQINRHEWGKFSPISHAVSVPQVSLTATGASYSGAI